ncbi:Protein fmp32, mitochondrial [Recurvomyces mirabilis]|uniref:Protein fmp32, mitochondrial n=1 Tax=Recurvomyces mirabilis TaxID=574656 RepID=A0AAE0WTB3_9PEZI|nr:Protein fmp32, mitochondrial [Recurvomyces mirabilis]KAK5157286.1 Protein fmp32, mitochondrial [Recurvomyces mirabilis]
MAAPVSAAIARTVARPVWTSATIRRSVLAATTSTPTPTRQHHDHHHHHHRPSAISSRARAQWAQRRAPLTPPHSTRIFTTTSPRPRDHHFDTLKFVQRLRTEGFTEPQAVAMMRVLSDVIEESIQNLTRTMVLREDQEKATYTQKVDFAKLRSELLSGDSSESTLTRASHERLTNDLAKLNNRLRDETQRTQASVRLDLNLEKGRIREEANSQELKIRETETRIEQESAALRERLEAVKFSTLQWLMGVCTGTAAIILGVWRLLM